MAELLNAAQRAGVPLTLDVLRQIVAEDDKQCYLFSEDGQRIRASQGHSIPFDLGLESVTPPEVLFHGTAQRFLDSIRQQGLVPRGRQHVHLSSDEATVLKVRQRHGDPVVLIIQAKRMQADNFSFYRSANGVWLTQKVPIEYIVFPSN